MDGMKATEMAELYREGKYSKCIKALTKAIKAHDPTHTQALALLHANRAAATFAMELYKRTLKDAAAALELDPHCLSARLWEARALAALGKNDQAAQAAAAGASTYGDFALYPLLASPSSPPSPPTADPASSAGSSGPSTLGGMDVETASEVVAKRGLVQMGSGDPSLDRSIAMGYLAVNTGRLAEGIKHFSSLLATHPRVVAAYVGRGTALAMGGELEAAVRDFSAAVAIDPTCAEAVKRRGQSLAALERTDEALRDLTAAVEYLGDADAYHQRGVLFHKMKNYRAGARDLRTAVKMKDDNPVSWNFLGLCLNAMGSCAKAIAAYAKALELDGSFKEALVNMGSSHRELAQFSRAMAVFDAVVDLDPEYVHGRYLRGLALYSSGKLARAVADLHIGTTLDPTAKEAPKLLGVALHALGRYTDALKAYDVVLATYPNSTAWYQAQILLHLIPVIDQPLRDSSLDLRLDPYFKEGWCKRNSPATLETYTPLTRPHPDVVAAASVDPEAGLHSMSPETAQIVTVADSLGVRLQYHSPGFMANGRQLLMGGLAIIEMAQTVGPLMGMTGGESDGPVMVASGGSSLGPDAHAFGWRDFYDVAVRMRQYSEPNDPVWWVDLLAPEQFEEGFGSQTPMVTGQLSVVRYHDVGYDRSFALVKELMHHQVDEAKSPQGQDAAAKASTLDDLYGIVGHDFYVITPCQSVARPESEPFEGTRLTLQIHPPGGYDFTIRTPCTPDRWAQFDGELSAAWESVMACGRSYEATKTTEARDAFVDAVLTLTFYWWNFMPLTRGSAMCGLLGMHALFLSVGLELAKEIPNNVQFDWEAILTSHPHPFSERLRSVYVDEALVEVESGRGWQELPSVASHIVTLRDLVTVLNETSR